MTLVDPDRAGHPASWGGWKFVHAAVRGTSHVSQGTPCQDAGLVAWHGAAPGVLLLVLSDGAGSAAHAEVGSALVCHAAAAWLDERLRTPAPLDDRDGQALLTHLRAELSRRAAELKVSARELACTLSLAALGADWAWFAQVGDGAIVIPGADGKLEVVFWPENGEYANQTHFVMDAPRLHTRTESRPLERAALLTDGLHGLALQLAARQPHAPFFEPVFGTLEARPEVGLAAHDALSAALQAFLDSPAVNARTDDDKTLILASRRH